MECKKRKYLLVIVSLICFLITINSLISAEEIELSSMTVKELETISEINSGKYTFNVKEGQYITTWVDLYKNDNPVKSGEVTNKIIKPKTIAESFIYGPFKENQKLSALIVINNFNFNDGSLLMDIGYKKENSISSSFMKVKLEDDIEKEINQSVNEFISKITFKYNEPIPVFIAGGHVEHGYYLHTNFKDINKLTNNFHYLLVVKIMVTDSKERIKEVIYNN